MAEHPKWCDASVRFFDQVQIQRGSALLVVSGVTEGSSIVSVTAKRVGETAWPGIGGETTNLFGD